MLAWTSRRGWHQAGIRICGQKNRNMYRFWNACWMVAQQTLEAECCVMLLLMVLSTRVLNCFSVKKLGASLPLPLPFFSHFLFPFLPHVFLPSPDSPCINPCCLSSFPGGLSGRHHVHAVRSLHRPLPSRHQRADVLRDDRELRLHHGQAGCHLGGRAAAGPARGGAAPAGHRGAWVQRQPPGRALRGEDLHGPARHHLRAGSHLRRGAALVVLRLLFLFAHPVHHYLLPGDSEENQEGRKSLHEGKQATDSAGKSDELHSGGFDHFIWILHHSWKHLQHCDCVHVLRGLSTDYGPPPSHQSVPFVL